MDAVLFCKSFICSARNTIQTTAGTFTDVFPLDKLLIVSHFRLKGLGSGKYETDSDPRTPSHLPHESGSLKESGLSL